MPVGSQEPNEAHDRDMKTAEDVQPFPVFDELGDWQEAKPLKKKWRSLQPKEN